MFNRKNKKPEFERQQVTEDDFEEEEVVEDLPQTQPVKRQPNFTTQNVKKVVQPVQNQEYTWSVESYPQVPTQDIIFNTKEKRAYTIHEALAELLNRTED